MKKYTGSCLCGAVQFAFLTAKPFAYECHCSVCQKATGSAFSATVFSNQESFEWISGSEFIKSYLRKSGYQIQFCSRCSSHVPNKFRDYSLISIPLGIIEQADDIIVKVKLHLSAVPQWVGRKDLQEIAEYDEMPSLKEILDHLHIEGS